MQRREITEGTTTQFLENINENFKYLFEDAPQILVGTEEPSPNVGKTGDIYIQYESN